MQTNWHRAVLVSLLMIFSSLAGCLEAENDEAKTDEIGTIMASTYHVQQLVQAIVGDEVTVELMSTSNIPVHDYEPTANDIIRLQQSDIFFYHGLELEPWVDATLSGLGSDAPLSVQTHTLPTGETLLDYESLLIADLCETLDDSEFESVQLANGHSAVMPEIHAESVLHQLTFPAMDDEHDEDGHDEDGHDDDDDDLVTPEELLEDADTDDSGTMTLDEFNATFGGDEIDVNDPKFAEIFDNNDADTSGDLDVNELEGFISELLAYLEGGHSDDHDEDGHDED
ncbi:MAG: zinc ABC transporter solute-binding protein, partial [Euryarchaeota archaeon]|nr:zinc ABC transporter solute-binding protein [Euryarchaeota archaeon]